MGNVLLNGDIYIYITNHRYPESIMDIRNCIDKNISVKNHLPYGYNNLGKRELYINGIFKTGNEEQLIKEIFNNIWVANKEYCDIKIYCYSNPMDMADRNIYFSKEEEFNKIKAFI